MEIQCRQTPIWSVVMQNAVLMLLLLVMENNHGLDSLQTTSCMMLCVHISVVTVKLQLTHGDLMKFHFMGLSRQEMTRGESSWPSSS